MKINKEFKSIKPVKNGIVVNLGDLFAKISGYKFKSTEHRVIDIFQER